jgi:hypothetical protein
MIEPELDTSVQMPLRPPLAETIHHRSPQLFDRYRSLFPNKLQTPHVIR